MVSRAWIGVLAAVVTAGCTGRIDDPPTGPGSGPTGGDPEERASAELDADPGRVTLHRLNRAEYNNTVRDLLDTSLRPADDFPVDDRGYGFDNIADVLSVSPLHLEMYQQAAEQLVDEALAAGVGEMVTQLEAETLGSATGSAAGDAWNLTSNGEVTGTAELPASGEYRITVRAWGDQAADEPARMTIRAGAVVSDPIDVPVEASAPETYELTAALDGGPTTVGAAFLNDYYDPDAGADRNLYIDWIRVEGPLGAETGSTSRDAIMVCDPETRGRDACADEILRSFARRAWRRPPKDEEIERLVPFVELAEAQGDGFEQGIRLALQAVLVSPHFLYRVEIDPDPEDSTPHYLSDYELATRLSYFLWSSIPDEELSELADGGMLQDPDVIRAQVHRMLDDPKARALVHNFAGQWLYTRAVPEQTPDAETFSDFDDALAASMQQETERFFLEFLERDFPVTEMLTADWSYIDERLARHYGMEPPSTDGFERVELPPERRAGLLSKGSTLLVTSYPDRTSPVQRGMWVLEQLMCSPPPPPPAGVEGLDEETVDSAASLRERLEMHRQDPVCASCHDRMDPIGLGLQNFDGIGAFRTEDEGGAIDATGELPSGETFSGAVDLAAILADDPRFAHCLTEQLLTYALGRGLEKSDAVWVDAITEQARAEGGSLRSYIVAIATSEPFRMRRGEAEQ